MGKLNVKQKAEAYDKALEVLHKYDGANIMFSQSLKEEMFPELKDDKDEQHRKWILEYLYDGLRKSNEQFKGQFKCAIAWLEKQDEPNYTKKDVDDAYLKGVCDTKQELEKQSKQKPYGLRKECEDCQFNYAGECKGYCGIKRDERNIKELLYLVEANYLSSEESHDRLINFLESLRFHNSSTNEEMHQTLIDK